VLTNIYSTLSDKTKGILAQIEAAVAGTKYDRKLFLVGGIVRDAVLGLPDSQDIDLVVDGELEPLMDMLKGLSDHAPVTYPTYGTAMITYNKTKVEFVSPRTEVYRSGSRKPKVEPGTVFSDVLRRDFTINTLLADIVNLEVIDMTGKGLQDLKDRRIRTPVNPDITFLDDPLRMLRAVRFAARFGFVLDTEVEFAMRHNAPRLMIVSNERVRDELVKILTGPFPHGGLESLRRNGLLQYTPIHRLLDGYNMLQSKYHIYDVWGHTVKAVEYAYRIKERFVINDPTAFMLAALLHDVGKPYVRTRDEEDFDQYHFYDHDELGYRMSLDILQDLRLPQKVITRVSKMVRMHMRVPEVSWHKRSLRKLALEAGEELNDLLFLMKADAMAGNPEYDTLSLVDVRKKIDEAMQDMPNKMLSPLNGTEIMASAGIEPGPLVGQIKTQLEELVITGALPADDKDAARARIPGIRDFIINTKGAD